MIQKSAPAIYYLQRHSFLNALFFLSDLKSSGRAFYLIKKLKCLLLCSRSSHTCSIRTL